MTFIDCTVKMPPACTSIIAARINKRGIIETGEYYVSTHPSECVNDDRIVAWILVPKYKGG